MSTTTLRRRRTTSSRKATRWLPPSATSATLRQWLKKKLRITLSGSSVTQWGDLSGNGYHATQPSALERPTVNARGGLALASGQWMAHSAPLSAPCTVAFVAKTSSVGAYANVVSYSANGSSSPGLFIFARSSGADHEWGVYANADVLSGQTLAILKSGLVVARAYNDIDLVTNGVSVTRATGVSAYGLGFLGQGGASSQYMEGEVDEIIAYSGTPSAIDQANLIQYLAVEHGV